MIDAAIVGLGRWGRNFVRSIQGRSPRIRFVRAVDAAPDAAQDFAASHDLPLSADYASVLADPRVGAVVLATPHSAHHDQVLAAAAAGKHVFCEKPLALSAAHALDMLDACRGAGVVLGVGHNRRLWPSVRELKRLVQSGALGELLHLEGNHSNENSSKFTGTWRDSATESPGGGLTGAGLHVLDVFVDLAGPLKEVRGQLLRRKPPPAPLDAACLLLEFEGGVSGMLGTVRATPFYWRVHAFGTLASAESVGETELVVRRSGAQPERRMLDPVDSLRGELESFADAIEGRAQLPISREQVLATMRAFEAAVQSLETGRGAVVVARSP